MRLYRITRGKYLSDFSGMGGAYSGGGRWNRPGEPVLYFATTPSVALLEMANYLPSPRLVPPSYRMGIYEIPDTVGIYRFPVDQLPADWALYPYPASTQQLGSDWLQASLSAILLVPSAAVPGGLEQVAVINPRHRDINQLQLVDQLNDLYNERAFLSS